MAALRATQFFSGNITSATPVTCYTVPAGHRIVLHGITVSNQSGSSAPITITTATGLQLFALTLTAVGTTGGNNSQAPYVVLDPGTVIKAIGSAAHTVTLYLSGTLLFI
jgi:hypothetical protein